jgi:uncharacterized protein
MAKLTAGMKTFIEKGRDPMIVFVGTASKTGMPNIPAKGQFIRVIDDETVAFADVYSKKTRDNLKQNPQLTVAVVNVKAYKGYQFKGKGSVIESGPLVEAARKENPLVKSVTTVKVEEIYLMDYGARAGEKAS